MNFNDLSIQDYAAHFLKETNESYGFEGKNVMFLFYQPDIDNAKAVKCLGAKKVFYVNPDENTVSDDEDIICLNSQAESFPEIKDNSIDLIIGLEILEFLPKFLYKYFRTDDFRTMFCNKYHLLLSLENQALHRFRPSIL